MGEEVVSDANAAGKRNRKATAHADNTRYETDQNAAIAAAIVARNLQEIKRLLDTGYSVLEKNCRVHMGGEDHWVTPLFLATTLGNFELIPPLLSHGANPAVIEIRGHSALSIALKLKAVPAVLAMLDADVDFSQALVHKSSEHTIPLDLIFADSKLTRLLPKIAEKGVRFEYVDEITMSNIEMVIVEAVEDDVADMLSSIVKLGWDANRRIFIEDNINGSALFYACYCGSFNSAVRLVELGSDVNSSGKDGTMAIECCLSTNSEAHEKIACYLVDHGFEVDKILPKWGRTVLHAACGESVGYPALASLCIEKGADATIPCVEGTLVLCNLAQENNQELLTQLITAKKEKLSALSEKFSEFIDAKQTANGHWPLLIAVSNRNHAIISVLLSNGANPNLVCEDGRSCLHVAALAGDLVSCKLLVGAAADVSLRSNDPLPTAMDFAINRNHAEVAVFLALSGADLESKINEESSAPSSIDLAPEPLKQQIHDALHSFETFSSLRKLRMMRQMNSMNSMGGSGFLSTDSAKKNESGSFGNGSSSNAASPEGKLSKSSTPPCSPLSGSAKSVFRLEDSGKMLAAAEKNPDMGEDWENLNDGDICSEIAELYSQQLHVLADRWGEDAARTHLDVINFLSARAGTSCSVDSDQKSDTPPPMCIHCKTRPTNCTILHEGSTGIGHICVCLECGNELKLTGENCPLCGEPISGVMETPVLKDKVHGKFYKNSNTARLSVKSNDTARQKRSRSHQDDVLSARQIFEDRPDTAEMLGDIVVITPRFETPRFETPHSPEEAGENHNLYSRHGSTGSLFQFSSDPVLMTQAIAERRSSNDLIVPKLVISPFRKESSPPPVQPSSSTSASPADKEKTHKNETKSGISQPVQKPSLDMDNVPIRRVRSPGNGKRPSSAQSPKSSPLVKSPSDVPLNRPKSHTELAISPSTSSTGSKTFTKVRTYSDSEKVQNSTASARGSINSKTPFYSDEGGGGLFEDGEDDIEIINIGGPKIGPGKENNPEKKAKKKKRKKSTSEKPKPNNRLAHVLGDSIDTEKRKRTASQEVVISGESALSISEDDSLMPIPLAVGANGEVDIEQGGGGLSLTYDEMNQNRKPMCSCFLDAVSDCFKLMWVLVFYAIYSVFNPVYKTLSVLFIVMVACNNSGSDTGQQDDESNGCSIGGCICSIFTFIFGGIVYCLAALAFVAVVSPLAVLSCLQPDSFDEKYSKYKFIDLKNPLKPADKDEFANFQEIDLERRDRPVEDGDEDYDVE